MVVYGSASHLDLLMLGPVLARPLVEVGVDLIGVVALVDVDLKLAVGDAGVIAPAAAQVGFTGIFDMSGSSYFACKSEYSLPSARRKPEAQCFQLINQWGDVGYVTCTFGIEQDS
jgi:hypothetical protein